MITICLHKLMGPVPVRLTALLLCVLYATGCDNSIDPHEEADLYFAIHGILDAKADTQFVRVEPARTSPDPLAPALLDATVRSRVLESGETIHWIDSLIVLDDGNYGHLFYTTERIRPGLTYRFEVLRPDGAMSWAQTTVPLDPDVLLEVADTSSLGFWEQEILWSPMRRRPVEAEVRYYMEIPESDSNPQPQSRLQVVSYRDRGRLSFEGWDTVIRLSIDLNGRQFSLEGDTLGFLGIEMHLQLLSEDWPLDFDLTEPDSNVRNGRGFLGSVNRVSTAWRLDSSVVDALGFINQQP